MASTFVVVLLSGAATGAGHGTSDPLEITLGPMFRRDWALLWFIFWPAIIIFANWPRTWLRFTARGVCCVYYLWLWFRGPNVIQLGSKIWNMDFDLPFLLLVTWGVVFLMMHISIWLPRRFVWPGTAR
jgi:hypothetical protein